MKVLQLGVGAVGEVNARVVAQEPQISGLVLADVDEARVRAVAEKLPPGKAETLVLDASDHGALVKAAKGADFVLNALATAWDIPVMEACLEAGVNYLDMGTGGPREITGTADLDEQLALDGEFAKRGLTAMVSFGIDPGVSDVFARALHDAFDKVESLTVLDGDNGTLDGYEFACSFSPETMIEECLLPPCVFRDGREARNEALSVWREFDFPAPVGRLKLWNVDHEEAQLMPQFLIGKGLREAAFYIALDERFVEALRVFRALGLNRRQPVEFEGASVSPIRFVAARFPAARRACRQAARRRLRGHALRGDARRAPGAPLHVSDHLARRGVAALGRAGHRMADRRLGRRRRAPLRARRGHEARRRGARAARPGAVSRRDEGGRARGRRRRPASRLRSPGAATRCHRAAAPRGATLVVARASLARYAPSASDSMAA